MDSKSLSAPLPNVSATCTRPVEINYPRWLGGSASCMAVVISQPFDLIKVRMQTTSNGARKGSIPTGISIIRTEGFRGLYHGLTAGFMRSLTYGTSRIALYEELKTSAKRMDKPLNGVTLSMMASVSGFLGAILGTPSDIANIRMQNDRSMPAHERRNYRHVFDAWGQMKRQNGWGAFTQGLWPNCFRCSIMTMSQLASYDLFKGLTQRISGIQEENAMIHLCSSLLASLTATTICSPMDVIRTQVMSSPNRMSVFKIVCRLFHLDGYCWLLRGWTPSFARLGPQTIATLVLLEQQKRVYRAIKGV